MSVIDVSASWGVGKRMQVARIEAGLEQVQIAAALGISRSTVSKWERGVTEPQLTEAVRWAELTGYPLDWFAEGVLCARRDSNPRPSDLYLAQAFTSQVFAPVTVFYVAAVRFLSAICARPEN